MESASPNAALLLRRVLSRTQETGSAPTIVLFVDGKSYNLHKGPLIQKSRYLKVSLLNSPGLIKLPDNFPGGSDAFERTALFMYGCPPQFDPSSIAALRCAAEFLGMTESFAPGNLCEKADLYLNQAILQSWDETLIVLMSCQTLLPLSEELLIVSRCIESITFTACMEILDPEQHKNETTSALCLFSQRPWSSDSVTKLASQVHWIEDLIGLPFTFLQGVIDSLRRQGMTEMHISPIIAFYANKWLLSNKAQQTIRNASLVLWGTIQLLPEGNEDSNFIPVGFYFELLARAIRFGLLEDYKSKLQRQIAANLHHARVEDLLLLEDDKNKALSSEVVDAVERIISIYASVQENDHGEGSSTEGRPGIADLWDRYLSRIATDQQITLERFTHLVLLVSENYRARHDRLYRAIDTFILNRPHLSTEEKVSLCKLLDCRKLSQEVCIEVVQNERMPIRFTIQMLFLQQLSTHRTIQECSGSFRYMASGKLSTSFSSFTTRMQPIEENSNKQVNGEGRSVVGTPLGSLMLKDLAERRPTIASGSYETAELRIRTLQEELLSHKESLQLESFRGRKACKGKARTRARGCAATLSWVSRRKLATKLVRVFRRMGMHEIGKSFK